MNPPHPLHPHRKPNPALPCKTKALKTTGAPKNKPHWQTLSASLRIKAQPDDIYLDQPHRAPRLGASNDDAFPYSLSANDMTHDPTRAACCCRRRDAAHPPARIAGLRSDARCRGVPGDVLWLRDATNTKP